jgi:cell filamentation protein
MSRISIRFFNDREVRAIWDEEQAKWWFSVVDIVGVLNEEDDHTKAGNYWRWLKRKLLKESVQFVSDTHRLKLTASDGKKYLTDTLDSDGIVALAKHFPNNKATRFLDWFLYSENSLDGQSRKKAYALFETGLIESIEVGTANGLQQIHDYLFGGLYDFAGQIRQKNISKGGFQFATSHFLGATLQQIDRMPEDTFDRIVEKYVEMNVAHPFMEGNGRSTRIWLDLMLKKQLQRCVDWSKIGKREYMAAMISSSADARPLKALLEQALTDQIHSREMYMKGIDHSYYYEEE